MVRLGAGVGVCRAVAVAAFVAAAVAVNAASLATLRSQARLSLSYRNRRSKNSLPSSRAPGRAAKVKSLTGATVDATLMGF